MAIDEVDTDPTCAWRRPAPEVEVHTPDGIEGTEPGVHRGQYVALGVVLLIVLLMVGVVLFFVGIAGASPPGGCGG